MLEVIDMSINQIMHHIIYGSEADKIRLVSCEKLNYHALLRLSADESWAVARAARHALLTRKPTRIYWDSYMNGIDFDNHPFTVAQEELLLECIYRDLEQYIAMKHQRIYEMTRSWRLRRKRTSGFFYYSALLCRCEVERKNKEALLRKAKIEKSVAKQKHILKRRAVKYAALESAKKKKQKESRWKKMMTLKLAKEQKEQQALFESQNIEFVKDVVDLDTYQGDDNDDPCFLDLSQAIKTVLQSLPKQELSVIEMRFYENKTLAQCGDILGLSMERIRNIEAKGLRLLRHPSRLLPLKEFTYFYEKHDYA